MRALLQRVSSAHVAVAGRTISGIGNGLLVFLCAVRGDTEKDLDYVVRKVAALRIFEDEQGKMNRSLREVGGEVLLISQFTLAADAEKGRRPSFDRAAPPETADRLYRHFAGKLQALGISVATGVFQAFMEVALINDGPVTILLGN